MEGFFKLHLVGALLSYILISNIFCEGNKLENQTAVNNKKLRHVHLVFRHGDRSPMNEVPEIYADFESIWPEGTGKLTDIGIRQQYLLGKWLRQKYGDFIPEKYNSSSYYLRSTDKDRTLMSAMANSAGFFSSAFSPLDEFDLHWSPVPVHTVSQDTDIFLSMDDCPRLKVLRKLKMYSPDSIEFEKKHKKLFKILRRATGLRVNRFTIGEIADFLKCMQGSNVSLPEWCTGEVLDEIYEVENFYWKKKYASSTEIIRLEAGLILHNFIKYIRSLVRGKLISPSENIPMSKNHMVAYSAHDTDLTYILAALGVFDNKTIEYAAAVSLEIYGPSKPADESRFILKVFYKRGWEDEDGEYLSLPICDNSQFADGCPLNIVLQHLETLAIHPRIYASECSSGLAKLDSQAATIISPKLIVFYTIFMSSFVLILLFSMFAMRSQQKIQEEVVEEPMLKK
ncbi:unnamed protein product [Trichobilharzia szidati]|nr:unnamed protein product [Trichobilharzia szidati]CAH8847306.1 unnamed protein product [Trichobilharzia szidati]